MARAPVVVQKGHCKVFVNGTQHLHAVLSGMTSDIAVTSDSDILGLLGAKSRLMVDTVAATSPTKVRNLNDALVLSKNLLTMKQTRLVPQFNNAYNFTGHLNATDLSDEVDSVCLAIGNKHPADHYAHLPSSEEETFDAGSPSAGSCGSCEAEFLKPHVTEYFDIGNSISCGVQAFPQSADACVGSDLLLLPISPFVGVACKGIQTSVTCSCA
eukprot:TRINITY_DN50893_c0_g1_i1.p1 TRINITY_DN50893_c0_g1~~TRINITY_DN50893_c0_g1_i1.p1  ORF type:complete len:213 (+),score=25.23 TRINITY_DN50893_c0_g1_i1:69-707(+)